MNQRSRLLRTIAWMPLLTLPAAAVLLTPNRWDRWVYMWLIAGALFVGVKWLTWVDALPTTASIGRHLGYLLGWPGLDARAFLQSSARIEVPSTRSWSFALTKLVIGVALMWGAAPLIALAWVRGWVGMIAVVFILHFGVFHLLSLTWQRFGVDASPLMNWPAFAPSVSAFWGQRWNTAFRDLTHRYLFRPLAVKLGGRAALFAGFFVSGLIHELVISVPAGAGHGRPTAFFLIQAVAIFVERSRVGQRLGLGLGVRGWAFTMLVLLGPVVLLFHPPFVRTIAAPFVDYVSTSG